MKPLRYFAAVILFAAASCSAHAADPVFAPGARIGLVPLVGWLIVIYWMVQPTRSPNRFGG